MQPTEGSTKPGIAELKSATPASSEARTTFAQDLVLNVTSSATPAPEQGQDFANGSTVLPPPGDVFPDDLAKAIQSVHQEQENHTVNSTADSITGIQSNIDSNQTSSLTDVNLPPTSTASTDVGFETAGSSILDKTVRIPDKNPSTPGAVAQATTIGIYPAPSKTPGEKLAAPTQPPTKASSATNSATSMDAASTASTTPQTAVPKVTVTISTIKQQTAKQDPMTPVLGTATPGSGTVETEKKDTPDTVNTPPEIPSKAVVVTTKATTKASMVTSAKFTPVVAPSSRPTPRDHTSAAVPTMVSQSVTKPVPSTNSEAGTISQKPVTTEPQVIHCF